MPDGASTPRASAPLANNAQDNASSRKSQADSLWHDGRTGRSAHTHTGSESPMESLRSGLSSASSHPDETETPWQSFFSNYLPMGRGFFLDRQNSSRDDAGAASSSSEQSTKLDKLAVDDTKANISRWPSIATSHNMPRQSDPVQQPQADQTTPTPGLDPLQKEPQHLRIDTHLADSLCDDPAMNSATTYSSADLSSTASRYSAHARSSNTSQTSSPISSQNRTEKTSLPSSWGASHNTPSYTRPRGGNPVSVPPASEASVHSKSATRITSPPVFDTSIGSGNGQFGVGVRSKLNTVLPILIGRIISQCSNQSPTVVIAEFGCLNSRSMQLLRPIIEEFAKRDSSPSSSVLHTDRSEAVNVKGIATLDLEPSSTNLSDFFVVHEDVPQADFRAFSHLLDTHPESYMNTAWQASCEPSLQNRIFCSYISRPFGSRIVPRDTLHFGFSLMDLHWTHTPNATDLSLATTAQAELTSFLMARATEFCKNGVLLMAFIARSEPEDPLESQCEPDQSGLSSSCRSPPTTSSSNMQRDVWATMTDMLVPCLQRLVSCGMLKSNVARQLLTLPMHPRTPSQTMRVLKDLDHLWELDWSCGANQDTDLISADGKQIIPSERQPLRLQQPAWVALQAGKITNAIYTEHVISMFKHLYESHFRMVLRERGKLGRGAVEFILDSLWDVLSSRIEDTQNNPLGECELEVQLIALRRK